MKASTQFEKTIYAYLESVASNDALFAETFKKPNKNIQECANYIMGKVKSSGVNAYADEEIFGMAIHYYDEDSIKDVKPVSGKVIVSKSTEGKTANTKPVPKSKQPSKKPVSPVAQMPLFG